MFNQYLPYPGFRFEDAHLDILRLNGMPERRFWANFYSDVGEYRPTLMGRGARFILPGDVRELKLNKYGEILGNKVTKK